MIKKWTLQNGAVKSDYESFPFAFRSMFNLIKNEVEKKGKTAFELAKSYKITSPFGKSYSHAEATQMALDQGLLTVDGQINGKEFKHRF